MELGADVVGGIPWIESSAADMLAHVRFCFDLAEKFGKDVSMLLDDVGDPNMRTLEMMANEAIRADGRAAHSPITAGRWRSIRSRSCAS